MRRAVLLFSALGAAATLGAACSSAPPGNGETPGNDAGLDATTPDATTSPVVVLPDAAPFPTPVGFDAGTTVAVPRVPVQAELVSSRTNVQEVMFAAGEMQTSGEPFAQHFAGRNLANYDRTFLPPDEYLLPLVGDAGDVDGAVMDPGFGLILPSGANGPVLPIKDLFGWATAVESYEYSKMHMNMVANQTTAGLSLVNGPILATRPEPTPFARFVGRAAQLFTNAGTDIAGYAQLPAPTNNSQNYLGFAGLWPNFAPFDSFDPTMQPSPDVVKSCTFAGGYGGIPTLGAELPEFECAYNSLHLPNRDAQVDKTLVPAVLGFSTWKEALWSIDFAGRLHDAASNPVTAVNPSDMPLVGTQNNTVVGTAPQGAAIGTYLGSTPLEDMWGLFMLEEMDNLAEFLVSTLNTTDGVNLTGFPSREAATVYDYTSPLQWFPAATAVTDAVGDPDAGDEDGGNPYPVLQSAAITDPTSRSVDLAALLLGNSLLFGETDARNAGVGQQIGLQCTFDGDPFPADDGIADGQATLHDRTLGIIRVAFIDLDRMHTVPITAGGAITVDTATVSGGVATPGTTVTMTNLGHVMIGLRQTILSLNGKISEYGAADPDPSTDALGILNPVPIHPPASADVEAGVPPVFSSRVREVFEGNAQLLRDVLTKSDGSVFNSATVVNGVLTPTPGTATLDSQAAAVRGLTEAFLVTNDTTYLAQARLVATHLQTAFWSQPAQMFGYLDGSTANGSADVTMTPEIWGWLESSLRAMDETLYVNGDPNLGRDVLEPRVARIIKLYLNGWDDLNGDQTVNKILPDGGLSECLSLHDGGFGGMQLGEQALTGELGRDDFGQPTVDRDTDCVLEIDGSHTGSLLAGQVHFHSP
ncbi:MAG: hypothetical protein ACLQVI_25420 [Polyangiaceae bacterium]